MRAAIYLRVSSREQVDGYSIPAQREVCLRLISGKGWSVVEEFYEAGESARTTDRSARLLGSGFCWRFHGGRPRAMKISSARVTSSGSASGIA